MQVPEINAEHKRKLIGFLIAVPIITIGLLVSGKLTLSAEHYKIFVDGVKWLTGIFVFGNAIEHVTKAWEVLKNGKN